jgi:hypothetical protein
MTSAVPAGSVGIVGYGDIETTRHLVSASTLSAKIGASNASVVESPYANRT